MKWFYHAVELMKKYGKGWNPKFHLLGMAACFIAYAVTGHMYIAFAAFIFFILLMWDVDDTDKKEKSETLKKRIADKTDENILLRGENERLKEEVEIMRKISGNHKDNPIKSNRIVSSITFATRFKSFVEEVRVKDPMSEEEKEYLLHVADRLLKWQTGTVRKNTEEYKYLERLGLMPEPPTNTEVHSDTTVKEGIPKKRPTPKRKQTTLKHEIDNENKN